MQQQKRFLTEKLTKWKYFSVQIGGKYTIPSNNNKDTVVRKPRKTSPMKGGTWYPFLSLPPTSLPHLRCQMPNFRPWSPQNGYLDFPIMITRTIIFNLTRLITLASLIWRTFRLYFVLREFRIGNLVLTRMTQHSQGEALAQRIFHWTRIQPRRKWWSKIFMNWALHILSIAKSLPSSWVTTEVESPHISTFI